MNAAKTAARSAIETAYNGYNFDSYDSDGKDALETEKNNGITAVNTAATLMEITTARTAALANMAKVPTSDSVGSDPVFGARVGSVSVAVENTTYPGGAWTDTIASGTYDLYENDTMMSVALRALDSAGFIWKGTGGSGGTGNEKDYTIAYLSIIGKGTNKLGEFSGSAGAGWMGTLNDWFVNESLRAFSVPNGKLSSGDEVKLVFTTNLGVDLGSSWTNADTSLSRLIVSGATLEPEFDGRINAYYVNVEEGANLKITPTAVNRNYQVRTYVNRYNDDAAMYARTELVPVQGGDIVYIGVGEKNWPSMNNQESEAIPYAGTQYKLYIIGRDGGANHAVSLINTLPQNIRETDRDDVAFVKSLYDNLTESEKANVSNASKLTEAIEKLNTLDRISNVKALIAAIPANVTEAARGTVEAAQTAYEDLTQNEKLQLTIAETNKLNAALAKLDEQGNETPAKLTNLTLAGTELSGFTFNDAVFSYPDVCVSNTSDTITVTPTFENGLTVSVNGESAASGTTINVALNAPDISTTITIIVTNADSESKTYEITVNRAAIQRPSYVDAMNDVLAWVRQNTPSPTVSSTGGEWAVAALARAGVIDVSAAEAYLTNLKETVLDSGLFSEVEIIGNKVIMHPKTRTENERIIIALSSLGIDAENYNGWDFVAALTDKQPNGEYQAVWQGVNGAVFALIALDTNDYLTDMPEVRGYFLDYITEQQNTDGTWTEFGYPADMTGMAVQALALYYNMSASEYESLGLTGAPSYSTIKATVDAAVDWMSGAQNSVTGDLGGTCESVVQSIVALSAINIDADSDVRFVKNGNSLLDALLAYRQVDGSFKHVVGSEDGEGQMASEQAAYALVAYDRFKTDKTGYMI